MGFVCTAITMLNRAITDIRQKSALIAVFSAYVGSFLLLTACGNTQNLSNQVVTTTTIHLPADAGGENLDLNTTTTTLQPEQQSSAQATLPRVGEKAKDSQAKGFYTRGELLNGMNLMDVAAKNIHKLLMERKRSFGTTELISFIQEMAQFVSQKLVPGQSLQIGDLSKSNGGKLAEHESHQNGLDADIVYISKNGQLQSQSENYWTEWFVSKGRVANNFDIEKNWELIKWISKKTGVQRIFVDGLIKEALCREAAKRGELKSEARALSLLRTENKVHQTHFHLRMACPVNDKHCVSQEPPPQETGCLQTYLNPEGKGNQIWFEEVRKTPKEAYSSEENFFITEWTRLYAR